MLPNGDWFDCEAIKIWVRNRDGLDEEMYKEMVLEGLCEALLPRAFRLWLESKWTAAEEAICDIGLIAHVHGLLDPTVLAWADLQKSKRRNAPADSGPGNALVEADVSHAAGAIVVDDLANRNIDPHGNISEDHKARKASDTQRAVEFVQSVAPNVTCALPQLH